MEKLVYVLWEGGGDADRDIARTLTDDAAAELVELGVIGLHVNVADESVAAVPGRRPPAFDRFPAAMVSFWIDDADLRQPLEAAMRRTGRDLSGFVVSESVPIRNVTQTAAPGERTPGVNMIAFLERPGWIDHPEWIRRWRVNHRVVAMETQVSHAYVRNTVVHALTPDAPPWAAIVEEGFTAEAAVDKMVWYGADGDPEVLRQRFDRMIASCETFLDVERGIQLPFAEYVFGDLMG